MFAARCFLVEFVGVSGVGKSTLSHALAEELRRRGEVVSELTRDVTHGKRRHRRVLAKARFAARALIRHPTRVLRLFVAVHRSGQLTTSDAFRVAFNLVYVCGLVESLSNRPGIHLLDQGVIQAVGSVNVSATAGMSDSGIEREIAHLAIACVGRSLADRVVALDAPRELLVERLAKRASSQSRLQKQIGTEGFDKTFAAALRALGVATALAESAGVKMLHADTTLRAESEAFGRMTSDIATALVAARDERSLGPVGRGANARRVAIVTNTGWNMIRFRSALLLRLLADGFHVTAIGDFRDDEVAQLRELGVDVEIARLESSGTNPIKDLRFALRMITLYRRIRPDVVHHFSVKPVVYGSLAAKLAGVHRIVCSITGLGIGYSSKRSWLRVVVKLLYRAALRGDTRVVFQNEENMESLIADGTVSADRTVLSPGSGVDTRSLVPDEKVAPADRTAFIMVSRMLWAKGVGDFVAAARVVAARYPQARFVLYGGSQADYASKNPDFVPQAWLDALGEEGVVEWRGFTKTAEVEHAMRRCAALVHPSSYPEGLPRTLIEAAAAGAPIITTDTPGCRDALVDGVSGFLVPPKSPEALVAAMETLLEDPERIRKMGAAGRERAVERFDERIVLEDLLRVYSAD